MMLIGTPSSQSKMGTLTSKATFSSNAPSAIGFPPLGAGSIPDRDDFGF